jgi:hypothetical protein
MRTLLSVVTRVRSFRNDAHSILARHEASVSRIITLDHTRRQLTGLSLQQEQLFAQALKCVEHGLFRPAFVMAWAAFMDFLEVKMASDGLVRVVSSYPAWAKFSSLEELRENVAEHQLIEAAAVVGLLQKSEKKSLLGLLAKRNECAHPSRYHAGLNDSLGYITDLLGRISSIMPRSL